MRDEQAAIGDRQDLVARRQVGSREFLDAAGRGAGLRFGVPGHDPTKGCDIHGGRWNRPGPGITDQSRVGPVGAVAGDAIAGIRDHEAQFLGGANRDRDIAGRVGLTDCSAVEGLLVIHEHLEYDRARALPPLPLNSHVRFESFEPAVEIDDNLAGCVMSKPM